MCACHAYTARPCSLTPEGTGDGGGGQGRRTEHTAGGGNRGSGLGGAAPRPDAPAESPVARAHAAAIAHSSAVATHFSKFSSASATNSSHAAESVSMDGMALRALTAQREFRARTAEGR